MKKPGEFFARLFKSRTFWWFIVCIIFSVVLWFIGPAVAFYGNTPLTGDMIRLAVIILIFLLWGLIAFKDEIRAQHFFKLHPQQEAYNQEGRIDRREKKRIAQDFKKLKSFLLKHRHDKKQNNNTLYDLPWYLVMGEQNAGKTSLLRDAELHLTYQSYNHISHRTATFQWVLAEEGLFIDLPHPFCWQKNMQQKFNWQVFLKYLKKARRRRPLNGLILIINLQELLENKLNDWQESIRVRIHELQQKLGMSIPVYTVFTHVDCIAGFAEFVMRFNDQERSEVLGITYPAANKTPIDQFPFYYDALIHALNVRLKRDIDQEWLSHKSAEMFYFPMQMAALREKLLAFAKTLFAERRYFMPNLWRGFYFVSSSVSNTACFDVILDESSLNTLEMPKSFKARRFFIAGLLQEVILKEAEFVGVQPAYARHYSLLYKLKVGLILGGTAIITGLWATGMVKQLDYNQTALISLQSQNANNGVNISNDTGLNNIYNELDRLGNIYHAGEDAAGSGWLHLGLLSEPSVQDAVAKRYSRALSQNFLPYVTNSLHSGLQATLNANQASTGDMNNIENLYNWLSAYLMFAELDKMDAKQVQSVLESYFAVQFQNNINLQNWLDLRLTDLLHFGFTAQNLDTNLIQNARQALWNSPVYMQAYLLLKLNATANNQNTLAISGQMDADSGEVFSNLNADVVPIFFTKNGYNTIYKKQAADSLNEVAGHLWVLGPNYHENYSANDVAQYQGDMDNLYWTDYINAWDSALSQINIAPFQNLQQAIDVLTTLSQRNSPIVSIFKVVQKNSDYGIALTQDLSKAQSTNSLTADADSYVQNVTNNIVTNHYLPLTGLLSANGGQQAAIQNVIASLAALQQYLSGIQNSSNPGLAAYNAASAIFAGQADKSLSTILAEAAQAPAPLSCWLNQIVNNSYSVIFSTAGQYLSSQWQSQVFSFYQQALQGRFPFTNSGSEVTIQDFTNFFKPGGIEDGFVKKYLSPFLTADTFGHSQWNNINNIAFSANTTIPGEITEAAAIRNTFFGGSNGVLDFTISPGSNNSGKVIFAYDGKSLTISGEGGAGVTMVWPPQNTDGTVILTFHRYFESDASANYFGPWGLFHLLQASSLVRSRYGSQYEVTTSYDGMSVNYMLNANSVDNPFDLRLLRSYSCPESF